MLHTLIGKRGEKWNLKSLIRKQESEEQKELSKIINDLEDETERQDLKRMKNDLEDETERQDLKRMKNDFDEKEEEKQIQKMIKEADHEEISVNLIHNYLHEKYGRFKGFSFIEKDFLLHFEKENIQINNLCEEIFDFGYIYAKLLKKSDIEHVKKMCNGIKKFKKKTINLYKDFFMENNNLNEIYLLNGCYSDKYSIKELIEERFYSGFKQVFFNKFGIVF